MIPVDWDILSVWRAGKTPNSEGEALLEDVRTESDLKSKHLCVVTLVQSWDRCIGSCGGPHFALTMFSA